MSKGMANWPSRSANVVVDNDSWILPHAADLVERIKERGISVKLCRSYAEAKPADVAFMLGCTKLAPHDFLARHAYALVVHESDLPKGRGFAPIAWQILEGKNKIKVCLIGAAEDADAGPIYMTDVIVLTGTELCSDWRDMQAKATVSLCEKFLALPEPPQCEPQQGEPTTYARRSPRDSEINIEKSIAEQFDLLRVVDNELYPAFFTMRGQKYLLKISRAG